MPHGPAAYEISWFYKAKTCEDSTKHIIISAAVFQLIVQRNDDQSRMWFFLRKI